MNTTLSPSRALIAAAVAAALLAACSSVPTQPPAGSAALRTRLTQLQADPQLAGRAPLAVEQANLAVTAAEQPQADPVINAHLQFMADRKISIAAADAHSQWSIDQRKQITEDRAAMQLKARTQEADVANQKTAIAVADGQRNAAGLQQQIDDLQAKETERGLVLTLGDVSVHHRYRQPEHRHRHSPDQAGRLPRPACGSYCPDRGLHRQRRQRRVQPGAVTAARRCREGLPRPSGHCR